MEANDGLSGAASGSTAPRCVLTEEVLKDIYKGCVKVTPARMERVKAINQQMRKDGWSHCFLIIDEEAGLIQSVLSRDLNQDSLHGAEVSTSEVGFVEEFTKDSTNGTEKKTVVTASIGRDIPDHESREAEDAKENGAKPMEVPGSRAPRRRFTEQELKGINEVFGPTPPEKVSDIALERAKGWNQENQRLGIQEYFIIDENAKTVRQRKPYETLRSYWEAYCLGVAQASSSDENAGDIPDHDGDESREADDAKENGHDGKKDEAKADSTEIEEVVAEKSPKKACNEGTEEVVDAPNSGDSVEAAVV